MVEKESIENGVVDKPNGGPQDWRPVTHFYRSDPEYTRNSPVMEFRLTYDGPLLGDKRPRPEHKHDIRRVFHKQLAKLWSLHPVLKNSKGTYVYNPKDENGGRPLYPDVIAERQKRGQRIGYPSPTDSDWQYLRGISTEEYLGDRFACNGWRFVPLVRTEMSLITSIHILFLRPTRPGNVLNSGDIDGRVKTLFDALQIPKAEQIPKSQQPGNDEDPFFCLVEDDSLITDLAVETDMLLQPSEKADKHPDNDSRLVITVKLHPYEKHATNWGFGL